MKRPLVTLAILSSGPILSTHASSLGPVITDLDRSVYSERPSSQKTPVVDYLTMGRLVSELLEGAEFPNLSPEDRAELLVSFMNVWQNLSEKDNSAHRIFTSNFSKIRLELDFSDFPDDLDLRQRFAKLRIAFLVVEEHRRVTSLTENEPLRVIFALLTYDLLTSTFERRGKKGGLPTDDQILGLLTQFRDKAGMDSRATWWQVVQVLREKFDGSLEKNLKASHDRIEERTFLSGLAVGGLGAVSLLMYLSDSSGSMRNLEPLEILGIYALIPAGGGIGIWSSYLFRPRRQASLRARADAFIDRCHAVLVQEDRK